MTTGAAQTLLRAYRVAPGRRILIAGNGPLNLQLACELLQSGVEVAAVAESAPAPLPGRSAAVLGALSAAPGLVLQGLRYLRTLRRAGVPLYYQHHISAARGRDAVAGATVAAVDRRGRLLDGTARHFDVDAVCLGYRLQPSAEIARVIGCKVRDEWPLGEGIVRDAHGGTGIPGVFVIGDGARLGGARVAEAEGVRVADVILDRAADRRDRRRLQRHRRFQRSLWSIYAASVDLPPEPDTVVCRCEAVTASTLRALLAGGARDANALKRLSRVGMGPCQGRYCRKTVQALIDEAGAPAGNSALTFTPRNPVKPVAIAHIAAEQPEWRGYRSSTAPVTAAAPAASSHGVREADVLVIGAGVIGTAAALYLARAGVDVELLDRGLPNGEASGGNAGSLHLQLLPFDFRTDGESSPAASALPLQKLGIELWCELADELQADFELGMEGGLMLADNEDDLEFLRGKAALEREFGVDTQLLSAAETRAMLPGVAEHIAGSAYCAGEGKINPMRATPQLLAAAMHHGARLSPMTTVGGIESTGHGYRLATDRGTIHCRRIVNAAGAWSAGIAALVDTELPIGFAPQQMLVTQAVESQLPYLLALARRHLTMKQTASGNLLIGGGWPARFDSEIGRCVTLRDSIEGNLWVAQRVFPALANLQLIRSWAAAGVMIDGLPIIGELPARPGFYNVVGANGYTMAPILGQIVADLILGRPPAVDIAPFSLQRFADGYAGPGDAAGEPQR
jgi:glycine/D-amino acid oxidase-like deaminating enzyme/bacterioferritin-associated ferredoxin